MPRLVVLCCTLPLLPLSWGQLDCLLPDEKETVLSWANATVAYSNIGGSMTVTGGAISGGITIDSQHDHRIAMSFLTLGMVTESPMTVSGCGTINTSFPGFADSMNRCGAALRAGGSP